MCRSRWAAVRRTTIGGGADAAPSRMTALRTVCAVPAAHNVRGDAPLRPRRPQGRDEAHLSRRRIHPRGSRSRSAVETFLQAEGVDHSTKQQLKRHCEDGQDRPIMMSTHLGAGTCRLRYEAGYATLAFFKVGDIVAPLRWVR